MDTQLITLVITFVGVLVIGAFKAYERINAPNSSESWDSGKFGLFVVVAGAIMLIEYASGGAIAFPADALINSGMTFLTPIAALFTFAYTTIIAGKVVKNQVVVPILASVKADAAIKAASSEGFSMGYTVTPTYSFGKSPVYVLFKIYATQPQSDHPGVVSVDIDWGDSQNQNVKLIAGYAEVAHTFAFVKNDKYTGHTFFPVFVFNGSDGSRNYFNVDGKGVEIWVESL